jgi:hypothetical protein
MKLLIPLAAAAGLIYYFKDQIRDFGRSLSVKIGKISFNRQASAAAAYLKIFFNVNLVVNNSSQLQGILKGGKLNLIVKDKVIATVDKIGSVTISGGQSITIPISVGVNTFSLVPTISDLLKVIGTGAAVTVRAVGVINTNYGDININEIHTVNI